MLIIHSAHAHLRTKHAKKTQQFANEYKDGAWCVSGYFRQDLQCQSEILCFSEMYHLKSLCSKSMCIFVIHWVFFNLNAKKARIKYSKFSKM